MTRYIPPFFWGGLFLCILSGCMQLEHAWPPALDTKALKAPSPLVERARRLSLRAEDRQGLLNAIAANRAVLNREPGHYDTLATLGNQYVLLGTAYTEDKLEKGTLFRIAIQYCEKAMITNPDFRKAVEAGKAPWEACAILTEREMGAMLFWSTALLYYFKEVMGWPEKVINVRWVQRIGPFLDRMEALDPHWGGGAISFTRALYYGILPGVLGGDRALSASSLETAIGVGSGWMLSRWGRAKYFHVRDGNKTGFREDLEWVLAQNPDERREARWWRVYFQRDARHMLSRIEHYF